MADSQSHILQAFEASPAEATRRLYKRIAIVVGILGVSLPVYYGARMIYSVWSQLLPGEAHCGMPVLGGMLLIAFVILFTIVAVFVRSLALNLAVVSLFWILMCVLQVIYPGAAPGRLQRFVVAFLLFSLLAVIHTSIQMCITWSIRDWTFNRKSGAQQGVAAEQSPR